MENDKVVIHDNKNSTTRLFPEEFDPVVFDCDEVLTSLFVIVSGYWHTITVNRQVR